VIRRGECDFLVEVAAEVPLQAIADLLGVPQANRHRLSRWANATLDYDDRELGSVTDRSTAAQAEMLAYAAEIIAEKRRHPGDDMMSAVIHGKVIDTDGEETPPSDLELQMFFNLLAAAGNETTRNSIAVGLRALIEHPDQWSALQEDTSLLPTAVEEILRWASSTPYNRRTATRDVDLRDQRIRAGDKVTLWWASANRDEEVFDDPFRFNIWRAPNPHLAFGHGGHFCLGAALARMEIRVVFEELLARCAAAELRGPLEWTRSNKHIGVRHMPIRLRRR